MKLLCICLQPSEQGDVEADETQVTVHSESPQSIDRKTRQILTESQVLEMLDAAEEVRSDHNELRRYRNAKTLNDFQEENENQDRDRAASLPVVEEDAASEDRVLNTNNCDTRL